MPVNNFLFKNIVKENESNSFFSKILKTIREFIIIIFIGVITWRIAFAKFNVDFSNFDFSDLLALILALFAIALAVAFYFKATDTSYQFYDNVYKFTQDTSELLGRIESGFGEKLRHMDEGLVGMRDQLNKIPFDDEKLKKDIEEKDQQIKQLQQKYNTELTSLATKAQLQEQEKNKVIGEIQKLQNRLEEVKAEKADLNKLKEEDINNINLRVANEIVSLIRRTPWRHKENTEKSSEQMFDWLVTAISDQTKRYLIDKGLYFGGAITNEGRKVVFDLLNKYLWSDKK
ncbi:MAG: hypothetical protein NTW93_00570 [Phycisphaerae bacterium]|nr:hypothetical protein [Phycisphaerae bacterium]